MKRLLRWDWDAVAGILAAVAALVLHFLHIIEVDVLLMISLVLIALLFLRDLKRERQDEELQTIMERTEEQVSRVGGRLSAPDAVLVGPEEIRGVSERFSRHSLGEMLWFNVCLMMFKPQPLFDVLLRPALENERVTSIQFILDNEERERWDNEVVPKARQTGGWATLEDPIWSELDRSVSFILSRQETSGEPEALLSFWGEPFMAYTTGREVPRYIFHVQGHSQLLERLSEIAREYRLGSSRAE